MTARTLHLIDVENLLEGEVTPARVGAMWDEYTHTVRPGGGDHVVAAFGATTARHGMFDLPARVRVLIGATQTNGADAALLADVDPVHVAIRYQRVVIASGDHIFTSLAGTLARLGVHVTVTSIPTNLATRLRLASHDQILFQAPGHELITTAS